MGHAMKVLAMSALISMGGTTSAAMVERTAYLDVRTLGLPNDQISTVLSFDEFSVGIGDRLIYTINFVGGDVGVMDSGAPSESVLGFFFAESSGQTGFLYTLQTTLLGGEGALITDTLSGSFGGPIGGFFSTNLTDTKFSYSGLMLDFSIYYQEVGRPNFVASDMRFDQRFFTPGVGDGGGLLTQVPAPVPLPAAAWLLLSGLGGLGAIARRRRARGPQNPVAH